MTIINERSKTHGDFKDNARITQGIKDYVLYYRTPNLGNTQRESIDMIAHKMSRIVSGEWRFKDHWIDVGGYAELAVSREEARYSYDVFSILAQKIKNQVASGHNWFEMTPLARQTLEEISDCLAKCALGDNCFDDIQHAALRFINFSESELV